MEADCKSAGSAYGGSNPSLPTWSLRLAVRTPPFHGVDTGSIPVGTIGSVAERSNAVDC
jgi:hypothetical protein